MKTILQNIQNQLAQISELKYIDEDHGQLSMFQPPVKFPCCLIDITSINYRNQGIVRELSPQSRQAGKISIKLTIADLKLSGSSANAPLNQKNRVWSIWELANKLHQKLHGFYPDVNCSKMLRENLQKSNRDDGVQEYFITYSFEAQNI
jgi:hypothetical protein